MVRPICRKRLIPDVLLWFVVGLCASGCREKPDGYERFVPKPETARAAVFGMLENWRKGLPVDAVAGSHPTVRVVDKQRRPGQKLTQFEIVGEMSADNVRSFAVRLTFDEKTDEPQVVRFYVVGIDPLWVFRQEDYELISHWMHPMEEAGETLTKSGPEP